jgi:CRISPR-associated protein Csm5
MKYRVTCLTPVLVGDGRRLSPIDYMVWRDQVNVLDQTRIFRLLSKGPRLDGYLAQLKRSEKLDFASWGGFAQNFAGRRIPFEHPSCTPCWERARGDVLFIPTFAAGPNGPFLPASALKGALRTGVVAARTTPGALRDIAQKLQSDRPPRRPADALEAHAVGAPGTSRMKAVGLADSAPVAVSSFKVYLLRTSTLVPRGGGFEIGWKTSPRGAVDGRHAEDSTPLFAEMAVPGTVFEGHWREDAFFARPEILSALNWREFPGRAHLFAAANRYSAALLEVHRQYAERASLAVLRESIENLAATVAGQDPNGGSCVLPLGWGGGFLTKVAATDTASDAYRDVLKQVGLYGRAIQTGLPFPKTRRIVFLENRPATLPGWVRLEVVD